MNIDAVLAACERLPDLGVTHRRTAISTVGWVPGIDRLAECEMPVTLALSLHAPNDGLRSQLMPVNDRYPLAEVLAACERYRARRRRKVFVEYVMLDGVNDLPEHARELAELLDPRAYKVNLIPYNPTGAYDGSSPERIERFRAILAEHRLTATVRLTRGRDIDAACGQLAASRSLSVKFSPCQAKLDARGWRAASDRPACRRRTARRRQAAGDVVDTRSSARRRRCAPSGRARALPAGPQRFSFARTLQSLATRCRSCSPATRSTGRSSPPPAPHPGHLHARARGQPLHDGLPPGELPLARASFGDLIPLLGDGLLTIDDDYHDRARAIMMPAFHREQVARLGRGDDRRGAPAIGGCARARSSTSTSGCAAWRCGSRCARCSASIPTRPARAPPPPSTSSGRSASTGSTSTLRLLRGPGSPWRRCCARGPCSTRSSSARSHSAAPSPDPEQMDILSLLLGVRDEAGEGFTDRRSATR